MCEAQTQGTLLRAATPCFRLLPSSQQMLTIHPQQSLLSALHCSQLRDHGRKNDAPKDVHILTPGHHAYEYLNATSKRKGELEWQISWTLK